MGYQKEPVILMRYDRLDEITPNAHPRRSALNGSNVKRKGQFNTPTPSKVGRPEVNGSPGTFRTPFRNDGQDGAKYELPLRVARVFLLLMSSLGQFLFPSDKMLDR